MPGIHLVENGSIIHSYPIVAPQHTPSCVREGDVFGVITAIENHATWRPTEKTRLAKARKGVYLKEVYGPTEKGNALAGRKMRITWLNACFDETVRIHATYDTHYDTHFVKQRKRASRGCIRMLPDDWDKLASLVPIGTRVRITRFFKY